MEKIALEKLLPLCSESAQRILGKLPPELIGRLYNNIPYGLSGKGQALTLECELSRTRIEWRAYAPGCSLRVKI